MNLLFNGASSLVTGSSFKFTDANTSFLIDCGMFQGEGEIQYNYNDLKFNIFDIKAIFITHAHLDHCGLIPLLVRKGYRGPIYMTIQTKQLCRIILQDSAKLQELNSQSSSNYPLLYDSKDVDLTFSLIQEVNFFEKIIINNYFIQFIPVGHVLGASSIYISNKSINILFSGDIGRVDQSIINSFISNRLKSLHPNYIIMESLYGDQTHNKRESLNKEFFEIINKNILRGNIYIPVFALHRTQEILSLLSLAKRSNIIDKNIPIYLDSPMAAKMTKIYNDNYLLFSQPFIDSMIQDRELIAKYSFFDVENLKITNKIKQSHKLLTKNNSIILAGSGMAEGGRIIKHLYNGLSKSNNTVLFVGYQAEGTLGRKLVDGKKVVVINEKEIKVKASVIYLRGFSAHGDSNDLNEWLKQFNLSSLKKIFLVHTEKNVAELFSKQLNYESYIPEMYETIEL